ncbi:exonuclease domain-containing protein [Actinomyces sp. S4-C9]|uniref:exonuclease domain-containing protein n=1 Tax=Actinomyces sp. S4-C9 TaxID=1219581 RepID=UPI00050D98D7|nr:exonuclease domain-containing protein [Actinomyces sp. S4-C9]KGF02525.1 DNA polymerase III subunit epsilon [Actinomyces sp. S4-C9]
MSWIAGPFVGFDTETTGVIPGRSRLVTASIIFRGEDGDEVSNWLTDPGVEIPEAAQKVHGISTAYAREHGRPYPQVLEEVAQVLTRALGNGIPVVAFNAGFDLGLMEAELARMQLPTLTQRLGEIRPVIDPLVLDRALVPRRRGKRTLADLMEAYGVSADESLHDAEVDTRATLDLLEQMIRKHPRLAMYSLDSLHEYQKQAHAVWAADFEAFLHSKGREANINRTWLI